jgi:predicted Na+-dependent transporter
MFPYAAIEMSPYGIVFLFILMFNAGLGMDWKKFHRTSGRLGQLSTGLILLFFIFPLLQWLLAIFLISDQQYIYGLVFTSLCPVALVAPHFSRLHHTDAEIAYLLVLFSMILCPIIAPAILYLLFSTSLSINILPLARYMIILTVLPMLLSFAVTRFMPKLCSRILPFDAFINIGALSVLVFSLFGTAAGRIGFSYLDMKDILMLLGLVFFQDFGIFFIARHFLKQYFNDRIALAMAMSMGMKNVAIAAGILLIYDPRSSLVPALAFIAHAFFFTYLGRQRFLEPTSK